MGSDRSNGAHRFQAQVALVVGGAHGIGKAIAVRLAREGAQVAIADIDRHAMNVTAGDLEAEGIVVGRFVCDVREPAKTQGMVNAVLEQYGQVDMLMYIAGAPAVPFVEMTPAIWDDTLDTNLRGAFLVSRALA